MLGISVLMMSGQEVLSARMPSLTTVHELRQLLAKTAGVEPEEQQLVHQDGRVMTVDGSVSLAGGGVKDGEVMTLIRMPACHFVLTAHQDHVARLWNVERGDCFRAFEGHTARVVSVAFAPDELSVLTASVDCTARVWDAKTGECLGILGDHGGIVNSAAFSFDGESILTACEDCYVRRWRSDTLEKVMTFAQHNQGVNSARFSPDDKAILTASADGTAGIWSGTGKLLKHWYVAGHDSVNSAEFCPARDALQAWDIVTASSDGSVRLWHSYNGRISGYQCVAAWTELGGQVHGAVFCSTGEWVLAAAGQSAQLLDTNTRELLQAYCDHEKSVRCAVLSSDGAVVVTASANTVRLWGTETGECLHTLEGPSSVLSVALPPQRP